MSELQEIFETIYLGGTARIAWSFLNDKRMTQFWLGLETKPLGLIARI